MPATAATKRPASLAPQFHTLYFTPTLRKRLAPCWRYARNRSVLLAHLEKTWPKGSAEFELLSRADAEMERKVGHYRRDSGGLYERHPRTVMLIAREVFGVIDPNALAAYLLHDNIEMDDGCTRETLARDFNEEVASYVWWMTKEEIPDLTKLENEQNYYAKLAKAPLIPVIGKGADKLHNLAELFGQDEERMRHQAEEAHYFTIPLLIARADGQGVEILRDVLGVVKDSHPGFRIV